MEQIAVDNPLHAAHIRQVIKWYQAQPGKFCYVRFKRKYGTDVTVQDLADWSYRKAIVPGKSKGRMRYGWEILYKGELVDHVFTRKEIGEFIKDKLNT